MDETTITIKDMLEQVIGKYEPTLAPDGSVLGGLYSIDFEYIAAVCVLLLFLFLIFRAFLAFVHEIRR